MDFCESEPVSFTARVGETLNFVCQQKKSRLRWLGPAQMMLASDSFFEVLRE